MKYVVKNSNGDYLYRIKDALGWYIAQIYEWKTYNSSDRLDFVILMEKEDLKCQNM